MGNVHKIDEEGKRVYEINGREYVGRNLYRVIINMGSGCHDPVIVQDWIQEQVENYLSDEWDMEYIERAIDICLTNKESYLVNTVFEKAGYDLDELFQHDSLNRHKIKELAAEFDTESATYQALMKLVHALEHREEYSKLMELVEMRASEDFDLFFYDDIACLDEDNPDLIDQEVRQFFNKDMPLVGYLCLFSTEENSFNEEVFHPEEVFICPNCDEPRPMPYQEDDYRDAFDDDMEEFDPSCFYCSECGNEVEFRDKVFIDANKHLPEEVLVARCV